MGEKEGRVFRIMYKGHMDKAKGGWDPGWEMGMAGVGGVLWWGENGDKCT